MRLVKLSPLEEMAKNPSNVSKPLKSTLSTDNIWATPSEKMSANMRRMQILQFSPRMRKVSSGHLLSIHTFCSVR